MSTSSRLSPQDDLYSISWSNPAWSHLLCAANVLDYFCDLSNPFYDRQCNNEIIRMQRLSAEQLLCMTGIEFYLHQAQEPILFVIRKQQRLSNTQVTPLAYYYIINGTVLQAPDLSTLLNSRLLTTVSGLNKVLKALAPCARYHPSDGSYSWDDPNTLLGLPAESDSISSTAVAKTTTDHGPSASLFQVQRTDFLLAEWANRFPLPSAAFANVSNTAVSVQSTTTTTSGAINTGSVGVTAATTVPSGSVMSSSSVSSMQTHAINPKEESLMNDGQPSRMILKPPMLPGVGLNAMPVPSTIGPASRAL